MFLGVSTTIASPLEFDDPGSLLHQLNCKKIIDFYKVDLLQNKEKVCSQRCKCAHKYETVPFASLVSVWRLHTYTYGASIRTHKPAYLIFTIVYVLLSLINVQSSVLYPEFTSSAF